MMDLLGQKEIQAINKNFIQQAIHFLPPTNPQDLARYNAKIERAGKNVKVYNRMIKALLPPLKELVRQINIDEDGCVDDVTGATPEWYSVLGLKFVQESRKFVELDQRWEKIQHSAIDHLTPENVLEKESMEESIQKSGRMIKRIINTWIHIIENFDVSGIQDDDEIEETDG